MKLFLKTLILLSFLILFADVLNAKDFYVYKDIGSKENKYIPSGWMGDYVDLKLSPNCFSDHKKGMTSTKIYYYPTEYQEEKKGWVGVYWQYPLNNWGTQKGYNLTGAKKLTFYAKGEKGGEIIDTIKVGGIKGEYRDTTDTSIGKLIILSKRWKKYKINLKNKDLSNISGGFCFVLTKEDNPKGATFYLDEIKFE